MFFTWVTDIAGKFGIPRIVFNGMSFFSLSALYSADGNSSDTEDFVKLELPDKIEMKTSQLPDKHLIEHFARVKELESRSYGVLMNSYELEPAYAEHYRKVFGRKVWHIGPVSLCNRNAVDKVRRGEKASADESYFLNWLDGKKSSSVLYICFGSLSRFTDVQLLEIAMALEASAFPFIWVIGKSMEGEEEQVLPQGFEERIEGKGFIIKDWAPQVLILDHPATGGFMTHCGWNSILEGLSAGMPLITWPLFAEQFYNEKLVTQVLRVGIEIGVEKWISWPEEANALVKRDRIEKAVNQIMDSGEEAQEIRERAKSIGQMAIKAVEGGGSSYSSLTALIDELRARKQQRS